MISKIISWFKKKAIETSEANIRECCSKLVEVSNVAWDNIQRTGTKTQKDVDVVDKAKSNLVFELCGPIPLDEVKIKFIDPVLQDSKTSKGAKMAINHVLEQVLKNN